MLPWVLDRLQPAQIQTLMVPTLNKVFTDQNLQTKVMSMILLQIGKICNSLANQCQFHEIQDAVISVIRRSFADTGVNLEWDYVGLLQPKNDDSNDGEDSPATRVNSAWIINQHSLCYNLPALAMFLDEKIFFSVIFPHLQGLLQDKQIHLKLSTVLPQTCLCFKHDECRLKMMELIFNVCQVAVVDNDCDVIKAVMRDMILLFKQYSSTGEENLQPKRDFIKITKQNSWHTEFRLSSEYFNNVLKQTIFELVKISKGKWRIQYECLNFIEQSLLMLNRKDVRESYLPFLMEIFRSENQSVKFKIMDIWVAILVKLPDNECRRTIHHFLNEDLAQS